ncbi:MAG: DUF642 domain-containing protein [Sphingomonadaceae bacterium]|nr:DUF642 domain-containing protein [Sphingomonadaceae bacterium]
MRAFVKFTATAAAFALSAGAANAAELIVNGGFEMPDISTNPGYVTFDAAGNPNGIDGWTVTSGNVDVVDHFNGGNAGEGNQWLDLVGTVNGSLSQSFATTSGATYTLTFLYGNNPYSTSTATATLSAGSLNDAITSTSGLNFNVYSAQFTASSALTTLTFANTVGANQGGIALDAVSITAVPEPGEWALMIAGFGIAGWALRRRRRVAAFA